MYFNSDGMNRSCDSIPEFFYIMTNNLIGGVFDVTQHEKNLSGLNLDAEEATELNHHNQFNF